MCLHGLARGAGSRRCHRYNITGVCEFLGSKQYSLVQASEWEVVEFGTVHIKDCSTSVLSPGVSTHIPVVMQMELLWNAGRMDIVMCRAGACLSTANYWKQERFREM